MSLTPHAIGGDMITGGPVDLCCPEGQKDTRDPGGVGMGYCVQRQKDKKIVLYCDVKAVLSCFVLLQKWTIIAGL